MSSGGTGGGGGIILPQDVPQPTDPTQAALWGQLRNVLLGIGVLLSGHGLIGPNNTITTDNWQFIVGIVVTLAPAIWGWYQHITAAKTAKERETIAVQAGVNLVTQGFALATDGTTIKVLTSAPVVPVTHASAQAIIANFAPPLSAA